MSPDEIRELARDHAVVDIETAGRAFNIGRTKARELARAGAFPAPCLRLGVCYRVPTAGILRSLGLDQEPSP